jgi:hypothetical protein
MQDDLLLIIRHDKKGYGSFHGDEADLKQDLEYEIKSGAAAVIVFRR